MTLSSFLQITEQLEMSELSLQHDFEQIVFFLTIMKRNDGHIHTSVCDKKIEAHVYHVYKKKRKYTKSSCLYDLGYTHTFFSKIYLRYNTVYPLRFLS